MNGFFKFSILTFLTLAVFSGCHTVECGEGTVEKNGVCIFLNIPQVDAGGDLCGPGSHWSTEFGRCFLNPSDICGSGTEVVWNEDETEFVCKATGEPELPVCPEPGLGGEICINGKIKYFIDPNDTTKFLTSEIVDASLLNSMELIIYDPLDYAASGADSVPLGIGTIDATTGTFIVTNLNVPSQGYVGLVLRDKDWIDDAPPINWLLTGVAYKASSGVNLENVTAMAVAANQLEQWHNALPEGFIDGACPQQDIYACGTWIGIYRDKNADTHTPIDGVKPFYQTSNLIPSESIAFLNTTSSGEHTVLTPGSEQEATSNTGTVLYFGAELTTYYGLCDYNDDSMCNVWQMAFPQSLQGGSSQGSIFIQYVDGTRLN
jgi:hypothetical protein